jgi:hypothetical protein
MVTVEYAEHGNPVSDFNAADWLYEVKRTIKEGREHHFVVSTGIPIHLLKLAIATDTIKPTDVTFSYCGEVFQANEYGAFLRWPKGFADRQGAICEDILRAATRKRRSNRRAAQEYIDYIKDRQDRQCNA